MQDSTNETQKELRPGYAGVTIWIGDMAVTKVVTQSATAFERLEWQALTDAAQECLDILSK